MANRTDTCHGSTVFLRTCKSPANPAQLLTENRSLPVSCEAMDVRYKIGSTFILVPSSLFISLGTIECLSLLYIQGLLSFFKNGVSVWLGSQPEKTKLFDIVAIINICYFTSIIPSTLQGC